MTTNRAKAAVENQLISQKLLYFCEISTFLCCEFHKNMLLFVKSEQEQYARKYGKQNKK